MRHESSSFLRSLAVTASFAMALTACGGGSGGSNEPPPQTVEVSGEITFDRILFKADPSTGLDPSAPEVLPAREVTVQAIAASSSAVLASTTTDAQGAYSFAVPASTRILIRARAEMIKTGAAPTWDFSVHNNTNGDALYALEGEPFDSGTENQTRNLHAPSGWGTTSYVDEEIRPAAPFAILDTVYQARQLVLSASAATDFPALDLFWSFKNRPSEGAFCPDDGDIGTSFYVGDGLRIGEEATGNCLPEDDVPGGIYILGNFEQGDTDEFDQHVLAHEFGHYIEDRFSRTDSIGGRHGEGERLDLRVAFSEGWGNAYAAMSLDDPLYRDSFLGVSADAGFNLEADLIDTDGFPEGWFSEFSVGEILWDIFDPAGEQGNALDQVDLEFADIFSVMTGAQAETDALTSIFSFASGLSRANASSAAVLRDLLGGEMISGTDEFGRDETNFGGDPGLLPEIYLPIDPTTFVDVCSRSMSGSEDLNKLGNRRFLRFDNDVTRLVTIKATGSGSGGEAAFDPDIFVYRQGALVDFGDSSLEGEETIEQIPVDPGTYIIEVFDFQLSGFDTTRCMTVSLTGAAT